MQTDIYVYIAAVIILLYLFFFYDHVEQFINTINGSNTTGSITVGNLQPASVDFALATSPLPLPYYTNRTLRGVKPASKLATVEAVPTNNPAPFPNLKNKLQAGSPYRKHIRQTYLIGN